MPIDDDFDADLQKARELAGRDDLDYVFSHRFDDPERVGMQALSLLAHHVQAIAAEAELPPEQVAEDAVRLVGELDVGE
jgi:hypothetical protein